MQSRGQLEPDEDVLEDGIAFAGVSPLPGAREVRAARVDGVEGRDGAGRRAATRARRPEEPHDRDQPETPCPRPSTAPPSPCSRRRPSATPRGPRPADDDVIEAMKDVVDPELGINVVDLGLVYGQQVHDDHTVTLDMTLTSAACPLTDVIEDQTRAALAPLVDDVRINWVWMPPWGPDKITDDGREQLRALGFNV